MRRSRRERDTERFFDVESDRWNDLYSRDPQFVRRFHLLTSLMEEQLGAARRGRALDVGCGSGVFTAFLAEMGFSVLAIDESSGMLDAARRHCDEHLGDAREGVEFRRSSVESVELPPRSFDVICCLSVLEYVRDDRAALRLLADALAPGGMLMLSVPNRGGVVRVVEGVVNRFRDREGGRYLNLQRHQYKPGDLDAILAELGLVLRSAQFFSVGLSRPERVVRLLERGFWAGMYGAVYRAHLAGGEKAVSV